METRAAAVSETDEHGVVPANDADGNKGQVSAEESKADKFKLSVESEAPAGAVALGQAALRAASRGRASSTPCRADGPRPEPGPPLSPSPTRTKSCA